MKTFEDLKVFQCAMDLRVDVHRGEWRQFLSHARGSLYEVEAELIAAWRLDYIDEPMLRAKQQQARKVGRMLAGFDPLCA